MTDTELRALCHRFFDAIERGDYAAVAQIYAPQFRMWVNLTGTESTADENLTVLRDGAKLHRRRTYDDRIVNTFANGFIVQYSVNVVDAFRRAHVARGVRGRAMPQRPDHAHRRVSRFGQVRHAPRSGTKRSSSERAVSMTEGEIRELCNRFFDAYQDRRVDELAEIYSPDCVVWHNVFGGARCR